MSEFAALGRLAPGPEGEAAAVALPDRLTFAESGALHQRLRALLRAGDVAASRRLFDELHAAIGRQVEREERMPARAVAAAYAMLLGRVATAIELTAENLAELDAAPADPAVAAFVLMRCSYVVASIAEPGQGVDLSWRAVTAARDAHDPHLLLRALVDVAGDLNAMADASTEAAHVRDLFEQARIALEEAFTLASRPAPSEEQAPGDAANRAALFALYGITMHGLNRPAEAEEAASVALERGQALGLPFSEAMGCWGLSMLHRDAGDLTRARQLATRAVVVQEREPFLPLSVRLARNLADICAALGDSEGEAAALRKLIAANRSETNAVRETLAQALQQRRLAIGAERDRDEASAAAERDPLTGLANRLGLDRATGGLLERARTERATVWIMVIDVDGFKTVNDRAGHLEGDTVLVEIADLLRAECRPGDLLSRWAGDEFVILLAALEGSGPAVAERIRLAVAAHPWRADLDGAPPPTVSIGLAALGPDDSAIPIQTLFNRADAALYRAKRGGRNRVEVEPDAG